MSTDTSSFVGGKTHPHQQPKHRLCSPISLIGKGTLKRTLLYFLGISFAETPFGR